MYRNAKGENIIYVDRNAGGRLLNIYMAGESFPNPSYRICHNTESSHRWNQYVFEYVISGVGYIEDSEGSEGRRRVEGGDFYFLNKMQRHIYYSDPKNPFHKLFLVFSGVLADRLISLYGMSGSVLVKKTDVEGKFREMLSILDGCDRCGVEETNRISVILLEIIQTVCTQFDGEAQSIPSLPLPQRIREYLDGNLYTQGGLDDAESYFFISKTHIINVFKREYGVTPMKYVQIKRAEKAAYLLRTTELGIKEIAALLRFADGKCFTKSFSAIMGVSPSVYRKNKSDNAN